jgi:hypothetical protein
MKYTNTTRIKAIFLLVIFLFDCFYPPIALALTGGPSQPEVQSFEPAGTSEMVDLSTGTFTYNIPLMDVGGYPINIAYNAGATMDQEASCVGLGWNINPGVINRNMRGLPDDFDGEAIEKEFNMKPNKTWGGNMGIDLEVFGFDKLKPNLQMGMFYNNYKGVGLEFGVGVSPGMKVGDLCKGKMTAALGLNANINLNSQSGTTAGVSGQASLTGATCTASDNDARKFDEVGGRGSIGSGLNFNSRQGLVAWSFSAGMGINGETKNGLKKVQSNLGSTASFSFARPSFLPTPTMPLSSFGLTLRGAFQVPIFGVDPGVTLSGYYSQQALTAKKMSAKGYGTLYLQNQQSGVSLLDFNREKDGPFTQNTPNLAVPVPTQDIYSVAGQGISGSYLLKRSDIGIFSDKDSKITSRSDNMSIEVGTGNLLKLGQDIVNVGVEAKNGAWKDDNDLVSKLPFVGSSPGTLYEPAYFKQAGEQSVESDETLFNNVGGFDLIDAKIIKDNASDKFKVKVESKFRRGVSSNTTLNVGAALKRSDDKREKRNQNISYLTATEAAQFGLNTQIEDYALNDFSGYPNATLSRNDGVVRKSKHISEITALRPDGMRYVYGLPAYNIKQEDYHFSVKQNGDCSKGLVSYTTSPINERSMGNTTGNSVFGMDNFYNKEVTPAYAHSYLLTAV